MSAELTYNPQTNVANIFSVRETPWHREGVVLAEAPDLATALKLAGHDFEVEVRPTFHKVGDTFVESKIARVTVRTDTGAELGAVGNWYTPLQNKDAFGVLTPLLDAGVATLETGGTLRGGADVWMQIRWNLEKLGAAFREVATEHEELRPFGLIANNHSGRRGVLVSETVVRVVCANTLGASEREANMGDVEEGKASDGRAVIVRHTQSVEAKVTEAAEAIFHRVVRRYEAIARQYKLLRAFHLDTAMFRELVLDVVAPDPRDKKSFNPESMMAASTVERAEKKRDELTRLWTEGAGHKGDHSAWEAYNAVAEALDHNAELWPTRSGVYRTQALMFGTYGETKDEVLAGLVHAAAAN